MTRLAVTTGLDAWDIPALRFGVAGLLLLPILIHEQTIKAAGRLAPGAAGGSDGIAYPLARRDLHACG